MNSLSQTNLKILDSEKKLAFSSRLPLRRYIAQLAIFSVDPDILLSLYMQELIIHTQL